MKKIYGIFLATPLILALTAESAFLKHLPVLGVFLLLIGLLVLMIISRLEHWGNTTMLYGLESEKNKKPWLIGAVIILCLSIVANFVFITSYPFIVDGDASAEAIVSERILSFKASPFGLYKGELSNAYLYVLGTFLKILDDKLLGLRLFSAIGGVLGGLFFFLFSKNIVNRRLALTFSLVLVTSPFYVHFSRSGLELVHILAMMMICLWLLTFDKFQILAFFTIGLVVGLSQYVGAAAKFLPVIIGVYLVIDFIGGGINRKLLIRNFLLLLVGLLIVYSPLAVKLINSGIGLNSRLNQVSILNHETIVSGNFTEKVSLITTQLYKAIGAFFYPHGHLSLFFSRSPYLYYFPASLMLLGLIVCLATLRYRSSKFFVIWFIVGSILADFFTIDTPMSSRDIVILPVVCIFIALGLNYVTQTIKRITMNKLPEIGNWILIGVFVVYNLISFFSYSNYENIKNVNSNDLVASFAGRYVRAYQPDFVYFLNNGFYFRYGSVPSLPFVSGKEGVNIENAIDVEFLSGLPAGKYCWIILDVRLPELETLKSFYNGYAYKINQIKDPDGVVYGYIFDVSI